MCTPSCRRRWVTICTRLTVTQPRLLPLPELLAATDQHGLNFDDRNGHRAALRGRLLAPQLAVELAALVLLVRGEIPVSAAVLAQVDGLPVLLMVVPTDGHLLLPGSIHPALAPIGVAH